MIMLWDANPLPATVASEGFVWDPRAKKSHNPDGAEGFASWDGSFASQIMMVSPYPWSATCVKLPFSSLGLDCWTCFFVGVKSQSLHSSRYEKSDSNDLSTFFICGFLFKKSIDFGRICLTQAFFSSVNPWYPITSEMRISSRKARL